MTYTPPPQVTPSKMALWEPSLGRLELGDKPFVVESFQIGSPDIRENTKNRSLMDGVFDDTLYHGASAITVSTRLASHLTCSVAAATYQTRVLRNELVRYCNPRLRPRLYWLYPGDTVGQWATVRGTSWPFTITADRYPVLTVQFRNPLGDMNLGDLQAAPNWAAALPGDLPDGRTYNLVFDRDYPNLAVPAGTALIVNEGNSKAGWEMVVQGPFDAGAIVTIGGVAIEFNGALLTGQNVKLRTLNKTIRRENDTSYYPSTNFGEWDWEDVLLAPGTTELTFDGLDAGAPSGFATIEWYSTVI